MQASNHLVTPWLQAELARRGLLAAVPAPWHTMLVAVAETNAARNARLLAQFDALCDLLNGAGIEPIVLKGTALLLEGDYPDPANRIISDIDVLLQPDQREPALAVLREQGYRQLANAFEARRREQLDARLGLIDPEDFRNQSDWSRYHLPPVFSADAEFAMELHTGLCPPELPMRQALDALFFSQTTVRSRGSLRYRMPSPEARLAHNFHHAFITDRYAQRGVIDWRHLLDASRLWARREPDTLDRLLDLTAADGLQAPFAVQLWQSATLLGVPGLERGYDTPVGQQAISHFTARAGSRSRVRLAHGISQWRPRLANLLSPTRLRRLYGPIPLPLALGRYLRWACLHACQRLARRSSS